MPCRMRHLQLTLLKEYNIPDWNQNITTKCLFINNNVGLAQGCEVQSFVADRSTSHDLNKDSFTGDLIMVEHGA